MNPIFIFKFFFKVSSFILFLFLIKAYFKLSKNKANLKHEQSQVHSLKWIVITSINNPTKQIDILSKQNGFKLLVVADLKTTPKWSYSNVKFLDIDQQNKLKFKSVKTTPFNSYTRKNLGYLYAIQNGAQFIYDTDDDNQPLNDLNSYFDFNKYKFELEYDNLAPSVINPFAHFGQPTIWPRGFPLVKIKDKLYNKYKLKYGKTSIVQQGVVNGDPDVDAIFRLTKSSHKKFNIYFDDSAPSVKIPIKKLAPFNSQNTLYHYEGFWGLYLPHSVTFRLTDIWRSYWCQRLLWLINGTLSYHGPNVYQLRNAHSYLDDFKLENDMYLKTSQLIDFLLKWDCKFKKFYECVIDLSEQMAKNDFWHTSEVKSIKNWLKDLDKINYREPRIVNNYSIFEKNYIHVKYTPQFQNLIDLNNYFNDSMIRIQSMNRLDTLEYFEQYCSPIYKLNYTSRNFKEMKSKQKNVTLLITFNHAAIYENIIFLKHFYQSYFKNVIFCGKNILNLTRISQFKQFDSFTFIEYDTFMGYYHYYCMSFVIDMNLRTNGILLMSDDVLLKYWNLHVLNENNLWFFKNLSCNYLLNSNVSVGIWMDTLEGRNALKKVFKHLNDLSKNILSKEVKTLSDYLNRVIMKAEKNDRKELKFCWMGADIFYVPRRLYFNFNLIVKLFRKNNVFLEFAVPTILSGLDGKQEIINGTYYWTTYYDDDDYNKIFHFAHPFKLSHYKDLAKRLKMCRSFVQDKINDRF